LLKGAEAMRLPFAFTSLPIFASYGASELVKWMMGTETSAGLKYPEAITDKIVTPDRTAQDYMSVFGWPGGASAPKTELTGDAKIDVHVTIDHDGDAHVTSHVNNGIGGVTIGTTGALGETWDDIVPGL
jgi:hypothetical protein